MEETAGEPLRERFDDILSCGLHPRRQDLDAQNGAVPVDDQAGEEIPLRM